MTSVTHAIGAEVSDQISKCICSEKVLQDLANALHSAKLCTSRESGQGMKATSAPLESLQQCEKPSCFNVFQCVSWRRQWKVLTWSSFWTQCQCMPAPQFRIAASISRTQNISQYSHEVKTAPCGSMTMTFSGTSLSSFSCRSFFKFFQDPLHHNCHSVKIRSS